MLCFVKLTLLAEAFRSLAISWTYYIKDFDFCQYHFDIIYH